MQNMPCPAHTPRAGWRCCQGGLHRGAARGTASLPARGPTVAEGAVSATGLEVFDRTLQTTNIWLDEVMEAVGPDRRLAWHVLGAVLRTLRDRLPSPFAGHLGEQLPLLVRGVYYEHFEPGHAPLPLYTEDEFLAHVDAECGSAQPINLRRAVPIILRVLDEH